MCNEFHYFEERVLLFIQNYLFRELMSFFAELPERDQLEILAQQGKTAYEKMWDQAIREILWTEQENQVWVIEKNS